MATCSIAPRDHIHSYNLAMGPHSQDYAHATANAALAEDMDINCGDIITEGIAVAEIGRETIETFIAVASGQKTKGAELGFGGAEFVPWQLSAVM